jgi:hypothetical protein
MSRRILLVTLISTALISSCTAPKEADTPAANMDSAERDQAIKQEAKSIEVAADEAAALIEAEANGEIKASDEEAGEAEVKSSQ